MNVNQFIQDAIRTESRIDQARIDPQMFLAILKIAIAAGNLLDFAKKNIYYNKPINEEKFSEQLTVLANTLDTFTYDTSEEAKQVLPIDPRILHGVIGKFTESTEMLEAIYSTVADNTPIDIVNLKEEIGDDKWYDAILLDAINGDLEQICNTVIAKLKKRYPEKFTSTEAINRDLVAERKILENGA